MGMGRAGTSNRDSYEWRKGAISVVRNMINALREMDKRRRL